MSRDRASDAIALAVEAAIAAGFDPETFIKLAAEAWQCHLAEIGRLADRSFNRMLEKKRHV